MKYIAVAVVVFLYPSLAYAIPPPDLILSISQSVLSAVGVAIAGVIVALGSVRVYFKNILITKVGRVGFYSGIFILLFLCISAGILYVNNVRLNAWRSTVDSEIRAVWDEYAPIYEAQNEQEARNTLTSAATEVTWSEFESIVGDRDFVVVDIRDKHAYDAGHIDGSIHIRLADLIRGRWEELLPYKNSPVFLVCYLGSTGAIAGDFLAKQGFSDLYQPKEGLRPTLVRDVSIPFVGSPNVPEIDTLIQRISLETAETAVAEGALVIDLRSPEQYKDSTVIKPDIRMFREFMTIPEIETFVTELDHTKSYVHLCNSDASCYQGEMLILDLLDQNMTTVGIYDTNRPDGAKFFRPDTYLFRTHESN